MNCYNGSVMLFPEAMGFLNKNPRAECELLSREIPEAHKITQAIDIALGSPLELDGKALLLKTGFVLRTGYGETKLGLSQKHPLLLASSGRCSTDGGGGA